jgi:hypothetical protein
MKFSTTFDSKALKDSYDRLIRQLELQIFEQALRIGIDPEDIDLNWEPSDPEDRSQSDLKESLSRYVKILDRMKSN